MTVLFYCTCTECCSRVPWDYSLQYIHQMKSWLTMRVLLFGLLHVIKSPCKLHFLRSGHKGGKPHVLVSSSCGRQLSKLWVPSFLQLVLELHTNTWSRKYKGKYRNTKKTNFITNIFPHICWVLFIWQTEFATCTDMRQRILQF